MEILITVYVNTKTARCAAVVAGDAGARGDRAGVREGEAAASPVSDSPRCSPTASPRVEQGGRLRESQPSCVGPRRRPPCVLVRGPCLPGSPLKRKRSGQREHEEVVRDYSARFWIKVYVRSEFSTGKSKTLKIFQTYLKKPFDILRKN